MGRNEVVEEKGRRVLYLVTETKYPVASMTAQEGESSMQSTELADRLHSAAIHILRYLRTEDSALGLSAPRLSALSVLVFRGAVTIGELATAEQVTPATTSRLVSELEGLGLAKRTVDAADRRVRRVVATAKGAALLREGRKRRVARLARAVQTLSAEDRTALSRAADLLENIVAPRGA
jgi:DNA-binding MarR family transcriptional regulator